MLLLTLERAPMLGDPMFDSDGMLTAADGTKTPGAILKLWLELRKRVGTVEAKTKQGVKFKVRAAEDLIDKVQQAANELGILIYPSAVTGKGHVVDSGTLAETTVCVVAQAIEDGSRLTFEGYGLGADNQDKAGGKAGTYAFKQALIQACLAGGTKDKKNRAPDTDDTDTPIPGGVRPAKAAGVVTKDSVLAALQATKTPEDHRAAVALAKMLQPDAQVEIMDAVKESSQRTKNAKAPEYH
jgi:3-dehydroquinate dehydratase